MKQALGMIETKGLVALFEATDAMQLHTPSQAEFPRIWSFLSSRSLWARWPYLHMKLRVPKRSLRLCFHS